jgi:hemerythrin-like metal-binding protein
MTSAARAIQLPWHSSLATNVPAIDADHRRLVENNNRILRALADHCPQEELIEIAETMYAEFVEHLPREEALLETAPGHAHIREHRRLARELKTLLFQIVSREEGDESLTDRVFSFNALLMDHFLRQDLQIYGELHLN